MCNHKKILIELKKELLRLGNDKIRIESMGETSERVYFATNALKLLASVEIKVESEMKE